MSVTYTVPRLDGDDYIRFVDLALRFTDWGMGYTSDGEHLLFTAEHSRHGVGLSCHSLDTFGELLAEADRRLADAPRTRVRPYQAAAERRQRAREAREVAALMELARDLGRDQLQHALAWRWS
ncbi:hypothetical protein [Nocardiopsis chromatogenes]|uniref:hypothetical protein n=1 Tax=Nocardiopsis chromatogenes TaxID=280239 RepID=UPI00034A8E0A|nr:hypothetical protein [Nocardiopsis chromatogenes]